MSLYHEAAGILLSAQKDGGSLKGLIFSKKTWKSDPKTLYALTTEAAKWSEVLSEVVEKSGILKLEKNLTPTLALLLAHDLFLSKKGIALPATHGLNATISRHKVRLSAELTKARLRRGFATLDALRDHINLGLLNGDGSDEKNGETRSRHPRWIRINTLKTSLEIELESTFKDFSRTKSLQDVIKAPLHERLLHIDNHIPNLVAIATPDDPTTYKSYKEGNLIFQEKASCFPAYLLNATIGEGDIIDACAAPGNKTTHLAAILGKSSKRHITACEKDPERSKTLEKMVGIAGAHEIVTTRQKQNFLKLDPNSKDMANVTALLLDPSCSGSGIFGRDEGSIAVHLPSLPNTDHPPPPKGKKRKRGSQQDQKENPMPPPVEEQEPDQEPDSESKLRSRLANLSTFQLRLLCHAMSFPAAQRITYSTCSIHAEENENVVVQALMSDIARQRGWGIMKREEQVDGMRRWQKRGEESAVRRAMSEAGIRFGVEEIAEGCIRCEKGGEDGTMGFFVAGFVRDERSVMPKEVVMEHEKSMQQDRGEEDEEEWNGFSSDEG